jgi:hypothetical protein
MADKRTFTTRDGRILRLRPISPLLVGSARGKVEKEWRERGEPLDPPTYSVQTVGGPEAYDYDATSIETAPDEDKARWALHLNAVERMERAWRIAWLEIVLVFGVEADEDYEKGDWEKRLLRWGANPDDIPKEADERRAFYLATIVLTDPDDVADLLFQLDLIRRQPGLEEEQVRIALESFRRPLRERARRAIDDAARAAKQVVARHAVDRDGGAPAVGDQD